MEELNEISRVLDFHSEITAVLSQKKTLYQFFASFKKMLVPDSHNIDLDFLIKVVEGKKKLLPMEEVNKIEYNYDNIIINNNKLNKYCWEHDVLKHYCPDSPVDKAYIIKLMSVLDRHTLDQLNEISLKRIATNKNTQLKSKDGMSIKVSAEFANILLSYPVTYRPIVFKIHPNDKLLNRTTFKEEDDEDEEEPVTKKRRFIDSDEDRIGHGNLIEGSSDS